jgi:SAM-dependent methyltransferase
LIPPVVPNALAPSAEFEFAALEAARRYRLALLGEFAAHLQGQILEVGAGIGQLTAELLGRPGVAEVWCVEPEGRFAQQIRTRLPAAQVVEGTAEAVPAGRDWDAILSVNVLEHIEEDQRELALYRRLLSGRRGALCLFVPARPELYAPLDRDFGHFRRYARKDLRRKLAAAGFAVERLHYFNFIGYFAWWLSFVVLGRRRLDPASVRLFDSLIFPPQHWLESRCLRPPFGQSLLAVARA